MFSTFVIFPALVWVRYRRLGSHFHDTYMLVKLYDRNAIFINLLDSWCRRFDEFFVRIRNSHVVISMRLRNTFAYLKCSNIAEICPNTGADLQSENYCLYSWLSHTQHINTTTFTTSWQRPNCVNKYILWPRLLRQVLRENCIKFLGAFQFAPEQRREEQPFLVWNSPGS